MPRKDAPEPTPIPEIIDLMSEAIMPPPLDETISQSKLPFWDEIITTSRHESAAIVRYATMHEALYSPVDFGPKAFTTDDDPGALFVCVDYTTDPRRQLQPHEIDTIVGSYSGMTRVEIHTGLDITVPANTQILATPTKSLAQQGMINLVPPYGPGRHTIYLILQALDIRDLRMKQHLPIARLVALQGVPM